MAWVKFHEQLCQGEKKGLSRATRFVFMELCLLARAERGTIRLPRGMADVDAVCELLGGNRREVRAALKELLNFDPTCPLLGFKSDPSRRLLVIPSWEKWNGSDDAAKRMRELRARKQGISESALRNSDGTRDVTTSSPLRNRYDLEIEIEKEIDQIPPTSPPVAGDVAPTGPVQNSTTTAAGGVVGTEPSPPTQKRQEGPTTPRQPASPSRGQTVAVWMSSDEQTAGEKVLTALREAGGSGQNHGPLVRVAEVKVVRELLKFSNAAGNMGRLGVDDIVAAVEHVAERERQRMLASMEVPKTEGDLSRWLISTVRGWRGNAAKPAAARGHASGRALQPVTPIEQEREFLNKPKRDPKDIPDMQW